MSLQLLSYIAPAAPATRRVETGNEPPVRPEIGFTPAWYRQHLDIDFGRPFHEDVAYRLSATSAMRQLLDRRFPDLNIGRGATPDASLDLLTGVFGGCNIAAIYGVPIVYSADNWPNCQPRYLSDREVDQLHPPNLDTNLHFQRILAQINGIAARQRVVPGFVNWQGVLNNAQRLRGQQLFLDLIDNPRRARQLFACVSQTMLDAATRIQNRQRETGVDTRFITVSNCVVNMISGPQYAQFLLEWDCRLAEPFTAIGIHNCAWKADAYLAAYASIDRVAYIDMGLDTDLSLARQLFPSARRAVMYTPMDVARKPLEVIQSDLYRIVEQLGACDIVLADIEAATPDEKVIEIARICQQLSGSLVDHRPTGDCLTE